MLKQLGLLVRRERLARPALFGSSDRAVSSVENMMSRSQTSKDANREFATTEDVVRILGELDSTKMLPIIALRPTIADVEDVSMWLGGDRDVFGPGQPLTGVASQIVTILTADEEEEPPRSG